MPLVVNEIPQSECNCGSEGVTPMEHLTGLAGVKNVPEFVIEKVRRYEHREDMPDENSDQTQYSEGLIQFTAGASASRCRRRRCRSAQGSECRLLFRGIRRTAVRPAA